MLKVLRGICAKVLRVNMAENKIVKVGEAVRCKLLAQSIGETGVLQLTLRTFHTGGTWLLVVKRERADLFGPQKRRGFI